DGDGQGDVIVGAYGNDENGIHSGAAYLFLSPFSQEQTPIRFLGMEPKDHAGLNVHISPDLSGDGIGDIIISAPYNKTVYIFRSQSFANMLEGDIYLDQADHTIIGENAGDYIGWSLASTSDMDGDGNAELLIGADGVDYGSFSGGMAYLIFSQTLSSQNRFNIEIADRKFVGDQALANAGQAVESQDMDGDGIDEIIIGADGGDQGSENGGAIYINYGSNLQAQDLRLSNSDITLYTKTPFSEAGSSLASGGDCNGDGYQDLLIGAPSPEPTRIDSSAFLVLGGSINDGALEDSAYQFIGNYDNTGYSLSFSPDIDGDGYEEIVIGAPNLYSNIKGGYTYLWPSSSLSSGTMLVAQSPYVFSSTYSRERSGFSIATTEDEQGIHLIIGAPQANDVGSVSFLLFTP
ncbi:MAG: hypothetical protein CL916_07165, partial [Deltaproteobacteria bacterium]|nr:hypothetical protein [Deltaproteobacteria bacterium]